MAMIDVSNLTRVFSVGEEKVHALDGVSLKMEASEFIAITGPSGSGKTTLMHVLGLLDHQTSGTYFLDGKCTDSLSDTERAHLRNSKIGFVFQNFYLLPRATALRNVAMPLIYAGSYGKAYSKQEIESLAHEALNRVGLGDRIRHKPNELSGGQRQRVAIARALVNHPAIIMADEPTGNLDSATGNEILKLFGSLHEQGVTIVLVTHDPRIAACAKRRIAVFDGKVAEDSHAT